MLWAQRGLHDLLDTEIKCQIQRHITQDESSHVNRGILGARGATFLEKQQQDDRYDSQSTGPSRPTRNVIPALVESPRQLPIVGGADLVLSEPWLRATGERADVLRLQGAIG